MCERENGTEIVGGGGATFRGWVDLYLARWEREDWLADGYGEIWEGREWAIGRWRDEEGDLLITTTVLPLSLLKKKQQQQQYFLKKKKERNKILTLVLL